MFGALISATDPVAVVALLKELGTSKRFSTLVDAESMEPVLSFSCCFSEPIPLLVFRILP
jgi:NhaP-type Na+/H+ and K+/H+ antiporter